MTASDWLIGSFELEAAATIVVDGVNNAVIPAGTYYLRDADAGLSLVDVLLAQVGAHLTTPGVWIGEDRLLRISAAVARTPASPDSG